MPNPQVGLKEISRILNDDGALFVSVDIGGSPTPDEPTVFSVDSLRPLLEQEFKVLTLADNYPPHSVGRVCSLRVLARKRPRARQPIDKDENSTCLRSRLNRRDGPITQKCVTMNAAGSMETEAINQPRSKAKVDRDALRLVVLGIMGANAARGCAWQVLHYLEGFRRLGFDVYYVEIPVIGRTILSRITSPTTARTAVESH